jgi:hypothetical protein
MSMLHLKGSRFGVIAVACVAAVASLGVAERSSAAVVLSTAFAGPNTRDSLPVNDGLTTTSRQVGYNIGLANWTVANAAEVDLSAVTTMTVGTHTYGNNSDPIDKGKWVLMLGDGSYSDGGATPINAETLSNGTPNNHIAFNSSNVARNTTTTAAAIGVFSFVFEVKSGVTLTNLSANFDAGQVATNGNWYAANAATGTVNTNPYYNVRVVGLNNATNFDFYPAFQPAGATTQSTTNIGSAGADVVPFAATAIDQTNSSLAAGLYRLEVRFTNKNMGQRTALDDFALNATVVIPEPATLGALAGLGLLGLRRRH